MSDFALRIEERDGPEGNISGNVFVLYEDLFSPGNVSSLQHT